MWLLYLTDYCPPGPEELTTKRSNNRYEPTVSFCITISNIAKPNKKQQHIFVLETKKRRKMSIPSTVETMKARSTLSVPPVIFATSTSSLPAIPTTIFIPDTHLPGYDESSSSTRSRPRRFSEPDMVSTMDRFPLTRWEATVPCSDVGPPSPPLQPRRKRLDVDSKTSCSPPRMPHRKVPIYSKSETWCNLSKNSDGLNAVSLPPRCPKRSVSQRDLLTDDDCISHCSDCSHDSIDSIPSSLTVRATAA